MNTTRRYAGVGSRQTPPSILMRMREIACLRARDGWILRSGGAVGADSAFELGARSQSGRYEIFRPFSPAGEHPEARAIAASLHPAWDRCNDFARRAHTRNVVIMLGMDLHTPVEEVLYWTPNGAIVGGTGMALRIAQKYSIPIHCITLQSSLFPEDHTCRICNAPCSTDICQNCAHPFPEV